MNKLTKTLLYYSLILSLGFFVVGIVTSRESSTILINLFYLPILLYLAHSAISKGQSGIREKKDSAYMLVIFLFLSLFFLGVFNVYKYKQKNIPLKEEVISSPIIIQNHEKNP